MPKITLLICQYRDRDLLERLLNRTGGCYDELLVVHDGPDEEDVRTLVEKFQGRFYEQPRGFSKEANQPFGFEVASNDWICLFDADEFPCDGLAEWLRQFRHAEEPAPAISSYQCIWPMWDGVRQITRRWENKRLFLQHRYRARVIGVPDMGIISEGECRRVPLTLHHQPGRATHALGNILKHSRALNYRRSVATALLKTPQDYACWRYTSPEWPAVWEEVRTHPVLTALKRLAVWPLRRAVAMILCGEMPRVSACLYPALFHALICIQLIKERKALALASRR